MNDEPSMTIQSAADECDINKMIARYQVSGSFHTSTNIPSSRPTFGDFADLASFQEAQNVIIAAQEQFAALPATIRDRFRNDPAQMLAFLDDSGNTDEAIRLGLCEAPPEPIIVAPDVPKT